MSKILEDINWSPAAGERDNGTIQLQIDRTKDRITEARIHWSDSFHHRHSVAHMKAKLMAAIEESGWLEGTVWCATQCHINAAIGTDRVWFYVTVHIYNPEAKDF